MLRQVAIVGCGATKLAHAAPAGELYRGGYFQACSSYARRFFPADWRIVSALYGLLHPTKQIEPYDCCLDTFTPAELAAWGQRVQAQLAAEFDLPQTMFVLFTGAAYSSAFIGLPHARNFFEALSPDGLGYRMQFLKRSMQPARRKLI